MRRCEDEKMFYRPPLLEEPALRRSREKGDLTIKDDEKRPSKFWKTIWNIVIEISRRMILPRQDDLTAKLAINNMMIYLNHG